MTIVQVLLQIAKDESDTLVKYNEMLENVEEISDEERAIVEEIIGDEYNHALIALLSASKISGIKIATDDIEENPNDIKVEECEEC